jgi:hypothetical protein
VLRKGLKLSAIGAYFPDIGIGSNRRDTHLIMMAAIPKTKANEYFVVKKDDLVKLLGPQRKVGKVLKNDTVLSDSWWNTPYKGEVNPRVSIYRTAPWQ